jgi:hypothetical protein
MVFERKEKKLTSQQVVTKLAVKKSPFSFLLQNESRSCLSASLASLLKRQIGKTSLTMNSTEIDCMDSEIKKSVIENQPPPRKFFNDHHTLTELHSSELSTCSTCCRPDSVNCSYCDNCIAATAAPANQSNYDSWLLNSTNFLSSTPANINESVTVTKKKSGKRSASRPKKQRRSQTTVACSTLVVSNPIVSCRRAKKSSSSEMPTGDSKPYKLRVNSNKGHKLMPRTSSSLKLGGGMPELALKLDYKRQQKRASRFLNSILPVATATSGLNSKDNFTNYGDFLVWYV